MSRYMFLKNPFVVSLLVVIGNKSHNLKAITHYSEYKFFIQIKLYWNIKTFPVLLYAIAQFGAV